MAYSNSLPQCIFESAMQAVFTITYPDSARIRTKFTTCISFVNFIILILSSFVSISSKKVLSNNVQA